MSVFMTSKSSIQILMIVLAITAVIKEGMETKIQVKAKHTI